MAKKKSLADKVEQEVISSADGLEAAPVSKKVQKTRTRRKSYTMDLRIHSPTSLGYLGIQGIDTAPALVRLAKVKGIDVIAVTDFYSGEYIDKVAEAAVDSPVTLLPGLALRAALPICDDIVLTVIFPEHYRSVDVEAILRKLEVPASARGDSDYIVSLPFDEVLAILEAHSGIIVPSRMDKTPYRREALQTLIAEYGFRAFDLAYYPESIAYFKARWPEHTFQLLSFSNANALAQIGSRISKVKMANPGFDGLRSVIERSGQNA